MLVKGGKTDVTVEVFIADSTTGAPLTGLAYNSSGIDLKYRRNGAAATSIPEATLSALTDAHADGGFLEIGNGWYRLDLPDAAVASGAVSCLVFGTITGGVVYGPTIQLVAFDPEDTVRLGLTALPNVASGNSGAIVTSGTGTAQLSTSSGAVIVQSGTGTGQLSLSSGAVIVQSGTGTGQISLTSGVAAVNVTQFGGTNGTFSGGRPEVNATHWGGTAVASANVLIDGAITAAKIASDAITDAKVASDVTIASVTGAVGSVTGAVGSVTGNVGGNVTGSVGSVVGGINTGSGTITTLDGLDTAQDSQHSTTQSSLNDVFTALDTPLGEVLGIANKLDDTLEDDGGTWRFTANAMEEAQTGSGGLDAAGVRAAIGLASANLDTQLGDLPTNSELSTALASADDAVLAAIAALNNLSAAQVNAEVVDVLRTDTVSELSAVPAASPNLHAMIQWLYMASRNKIDVTASALEIHNDAGTVVGTKNLSDDGTTYSEAKAS